jgi:hypothetical protein
MRPRVAAACPLTFANLALPGAACGSGTLGDLEER